MNDMYSDSRTLTESWMMAEFEGEELTSQSELNQEQREFLHGYWPFLNDYYSPLRPVFSPAYGRFLRNLREGETAWLRDGIIPLTWFLRRNSPQSFRGSLIAPEKLARFVPSDWRAKFSFYRLITREVTRPKTLFIAGPVEEGYSNLEHTERLLDAAVKKLGKSKQPEVKLYCPVKWGGDKFPAEFFRLVFSRFPEAEVISWHSLANLGTLTDSAYLELNGNYIISDSYVQYHMLSRGAGLLLGQSQGKVFVPLSRYHGAAVSTVSKVEPRSNDEALMNFSREMANLNEVHSCGLWPQSLEVWCRGLE